MAILAEPKQKLRWSLNPRGNLWANDDNKFGQKMLERMGWSKGKGLGKDENGIIEHVKVAQKNDLKGIGWNDSDGNWIAHQDEFNSILTSLNKGLPGEMLVPENLGSYGNSCSGSKVSLEERSKNFKSRVHYQKFLHSKDVRQYSKQDMDCIFGVKCCADNPEPHEPGEDKIVLLKRENLSTDTDDYVIFHGIKLHKSNSSMSDYFAQKMKQKKLSRQNTAHKSSSCSTSDSQQKVDCKEEILLGNTDKVSTFPVMIAEIMKKKNKKSVQDSFNVFKNFGNASSITANPLFKIEPSPRVPPKKRQYLSEIELSEKVYTKRIKYSEQPVTVSPHRILKSCLRNTRANGYSVNTKKGVRFRDEQLASYAENAVLTTESTDSENSRTTISSEHHITVPNVDLQNSASTASSDKKKNVIHSNTELTACVEPCQKLDFLSNNKTWDISEKLTKKLKHYKKVSKRIREHDVFSTTNLLEIKGYGNW